VAAEQSIDNSQRVAKIFENSALLLSLALARRGVAVRAFLQLAIQSQRPFRSFGKFGFEFPPPNGSPEKLLFVLAAGLIQTQRPLCALLKFNLVLPRDGDCSFEFFLQRLNTILRILDDPAGIFQL